MASDDRRTLARINTALTHPSVDVIMRTIISAATQPGRRTIWSGIAGILASTTLLAAIACAGGDSSTGPSNRDPSGTYSLRQVDQKKIPTVIFRGPFTFPAGPTVDPFVFTITGGELILRDNGEIHAAIDYKAVGDGKELTGTNPADGTYEIQGNQIFISTAQGGGTLGSFRDGVITLDLDVMGIGETRTFAFRYVP
jgi:hypothetical protein